LAATVEIRDKMIPSRRDFPFKSNTVQKVAGTLRGCDFTVQITLRVISAVRKPLVFEATSHGVRSSLPFEYKYEYRFTEYEYDFEALHTSDEREVPNESPNFRVLRVFRGSINSSVPCRSRVSAVT